MKIKVLKELKSYYSQGARESVYIIKFKIVEIKDEEILKISQLTPIAININPNGCNIANFSFYPRNFLTDFNGIFNLKSNEEGLLNFDELKDIEISFKSEKDADKYKEFVLNQFTNEINRINSLDSTVIKEEIYEINSEEGIKQIYEGAKKVLDESSEDYKEIVEKNKEAWKKLADL